jgi:hypothetical protein
MDNPADYSACKSAGGIHVWRKSDPEGPGWLYYPSCRGWAFAAQVLQMGVLN